MAVNPQAAHQVIAQLRSEGHAPNDILGNVNTFIDRMWARTTPNMAAQGPRAAATGGMVRAGGAPNSKAEAEALVREITGTFQDLTTLAAKGRFGTITDQEYAAGIRSYVDKLAELQKLRKEWDAAANNASHVAIKFKSGGPFIYPTSTPENYAMLVAAGSSGKAVWEIGWGPNRHPSYTFVTITPERTIQSHPVTSSWVICFYLLSERPLQP